MSNIRAIETRYKGFRFRSRAEAKWAVCFDALGIEWEYEKEGYDLGDLGWYLPDFWLPQFGCFAEVKGKPFTQEEFDKASALPDCCLLLDGPPNMISYRCVGTEWNHAEPFTYADYLADNPHNGYGRIVLSQSKYKGRLWALFGETIDDYDGALMRSAILAVRAARFEFGETGMGRLSDDEL
jgi:hypothetical protein